MGIGPIFQALVIDEPVTDYRSMRRADAAAIRAIAHEVLLGGSFLQAEKAYLSLAHTDGEIDATVAAFAAAAARYAAVS